HQRNRYLRGEVMLEQLQGQRDDFEARLLALARPRRAVADYERLAQHLWGHRGQWFTFLTAPAVEATNWKAEQALRPAVVNRKVWGGNRTAAGARAQSVLMSVLRTAYQRGRDAIDYLSHTLRGTPDRTPLLPAMTAPSG